MIRAIIFDCFGVLCSDSWLPYKNRMFGHSPELEAEATRLNKAVDAGELSYDEFLRSVAGLANIPLGDVQGEIEHNIPNESLFALIQTLKPDYKIGLLSNAGQNWLNDIFEPSQVALFDEVVLSCDIRIIKPEAGAYRAIIAKLGVEPDECVFIDDQPKYVEGATQVGMQAILYVGFEQLTTDLGRALS